MFRSWKNSILEVICQDEVPDDGHREIQDMQSNRITTKSELFPLVLRRQSTPVVTELPGDVSLGAVGAEVGDYPETILRRLQQLQHRCS